MKTTPATVIKAKGVLGLVISSESPSVSIVAGESTIPLHVTQTFSLEGAGDKLRLTTEGAIVVARRINGARIAISVIPGHPVMKSAQRMITKLGRWVAEQGAVPASAEADQPAPAGTDGEGDR